MACDCLSRIESNIFKAVPGLEGHVMKNKYAWLLDQVVPFLHPWLNLKELLSCRGVSRRCHQGVDNYLENHPIQTAVAHHENEVSDHSWFVGTTDTYRKWECFGQWKFVEEPGKTEWLTNFKSDMEKLPTTHNPIVGRAVGIFFGPDDDPVSWIQTLEILRKFGSHIWFLNLGIRHWHDERQVCQMMLEVLYLVPNLKALEITPGTMLDLVENGPLQEFLEASTELLPLLNFLETVTTYDWDPTASLIGRFLTVHYSAQIKRLYTARLLAEDLDIFPGLTELTLSEIDFITGEATRTLRSLEAPNLTTLSLTLRNFEDDEHGLSWNDVVSWLQPFKQIQSFHFNTDNFRIRHQRLTLQTSEVIEPIASLKSLAVRTSSYDFDLDLLPSLFPSLEYIKVIGNYRQNNVPGSRTNQEKIMNNVTIWDELPTLKQIIVAVSRDASNTRRRTRAGAEMLKGQRSHPANPRYLKNSISEDVDSMAVVTWGEEQQEAFEAVVVELDGDQDRAAAADGESMQQVTED